MLTKDIIDNYYSKNRIILHKMFKEIEKKIDGRICHSSILLLKILIELEKINNYLEIGVHNGGSMSLLLSDTIKRNLYGIDLFEDMYDLKKHKNKDKYLKYQYFRRDKLNILKTMKNLNNIKSLFNNTSNIQLIQGNSYFDITEEKFNKNCSHSIDLLFIDGDHTRDGVKNDFDRYVKYVKKGGFIIFDDYHHPIIKKYVNLTFKNNKNFKLITIFKSDISKAKDCLIQKLV
jgi:predicted O-methyltransferase YrrM